MKRIPCTSVLFAVLCVTFLPALYCQSTMPVPADGIQYVSTKGSDQSNGLSWGTAKSTIAAAYAALPACGRWPHCGQVRVGQGKYSVPSSIDVASPRVTIRGRGTSTEVDYVGTSGCAFRFSGFDSASGTTGSGLYGMLINGSRAGAGTCGLETRDTDGFHASNLTIAYFEGRGSVGWLDDAVSTFNERFDVSMTLYENTTGWRILSANTKRNSTFGYGRFLLWINEDSGQTGVECEGNGTTHPILSYSDVQIILNDSGSAVGISLGNGAVWSGNTLTLHVEGGALGIRLDGTSTFTGTGSYEEYNSHDSIAPGAIYGILGDTGAAVNATAPNLFGINSWYGKGQTFSIGRHGDCSTGGIGVLICEPMGATNSPFAVMHGSTYLFRLDSSGEVWFAGSSFLPPKGGGRLANFGAQGISAGTVTLTGGFASHTFTTAYPAPPICTATDETRTSAVRVTSSRAAVAISGSGSDVIAWICAPKAN